MSATLRTLTLAISVAISGLAASGCIIVDDDDSVLTIDNQSEFFLDEIRLASVDSGSWGPNLAPAGGLAPDEILELTDIDCDFYDLRVTDEEGIGCDIFDIDLCLNDATFVYRNNTCDIFNAAGKALMAADRPAAPDQKAKQAE